MLFYIYYLLLIILFYVPALGVDLSRLKETEISKRRNILLLLATFPLKISSDYLIKAYYIIEICTALEAFEFCYILNYKSGDYSHTFHT